MAAWSLAPVTRLQRFGTSGVQPGSSPIDAAIDRRYRRTGSGGRVGAGPPVGVHCGAARARNARGPGAGTGGWMGRRAGVFWGGIARAGALAVVCLALAHCSGPFASREYSPRVV